jgi:hypothetical protein
VTATPRPKQSVLACQCGITFEPLPWFDPDRDEVLCDECANSKRRS